VIFPSRMPPLGSSLLCTALALGGGVDAAAAPLLHCHLQQSDTVTEIDVAPTANPYSVAALPVNRFRFKAVVIGDADKIDYIKLYTYYETGNKSASGAKDVRLLHVAKYLAPQPRNGTGPSSLTGTVYLHEPGLGREFSYDCALREAGA
jgi:plasmid stabilization system protein ParE